MTRPPETRLLTEANAAAYAADSSTPLGRAVRELNPSGAVSPAAYSNGATPDSTHILAALNAASGKTVRLAAATYVGDLVIPNGSTLVGAGIGKTTIQGRIVIGSDTTVTDLTVNHGGTTSSTFGNNSFNSQVNRVQFKAGNASASFYVNDTRAVGHTFTECLFSDNTAGGNGVQFIDKGTDAKHLENIIFRRCTFRNNNRMNFECIQRSDAGNPVVLGYRNISHYNCRFEAPALDGNTVNINVSYDSQMLTDNTARSSGYSIVKDCDILGGGYGLELAGAIHMRIENNLIRDTTGFLLSMSQVGANPAYCHFTGNKFIGTVAGASITFSGTFNLVVDNYTQTPGQVRFATSGDSQITGNYFDGTGTTTLSLEHSYRLSFMGNTILKGTAQTVLNIYADSVHNSFIGNFVQQVNVLWDTRDGTALHLHGNMLYRNSHFMIDNEFETIAALPVATALYQGKTFVVRGGAGVADVLYMCMKKADDTYAWAQVAAG